jgi:8-oxo-dGTP pyrophosphatase MutT (NUDIX family)
MKNSRIGSGGGKVKGSNGAAIFFTDGSSVLLLKRSDSGDYPDTWALPGGTAKTGESAIGTAIRETKEETGLDSIPGHRIESLATKNGRQSFTVFIYRVGEHFDIELSHEHTDWEWVDFNTFSKKTLHPKFEDNLERYLRVIRRKIGSFDEWVNFTESSIYPNCQ